jgi:hypothetical protein
VRPDVERGFSEWVRAQPPRLHRAALLLHAEPISSHGAVPDSGDSLRRQPQGMGDRHAGALLVAVVLSALAMLVTGCGRQAPAAGRSEREQAGTSRIDPAALLQPTELGPGWLESPTGPGRPAWPWDHVDCPGYRREDYRAQLHRRDAVQRFYRAAGSAPIAHHIVETYEPGWAGTALDDTRRMLRQCASYVVLGSRVSFSVADSAYLGGAGLLVRGRIEHVGSPATVAYFVTVRRGDAISTLNLPDPGDLAAVEAIAARQLARLG